MDTQRVLMNLDRLHEAQIQANTALRQQGEALRRLTLTLREIASIQLETVQAIKRLDREERTPQPKSQPSSRLIASDVMQLAMAGLLLLYVIRGGDPGLIVKALFGG